MPYAGFRYIAYQVPTVARTAIFPAGNAIYRIPPGDHPIIAPSPALTPVLQGKVAALDDDAQRRVERLIGAMLAAQEQTQRTCADSEYILKIFMAPEFYFRPDNDEVSYTYDQYQAIKNVLRETIGSYYCFKDWLIIPGTILWKWDQQSKMRPNYTPPINVYLNSAIYVSRADESFMFSRDVKSSRVIEKAEASSIDGISKTGVSTDKMEWDVLESDGLLWPKYQTPAKREKHIFTKGGITFGLDICVEHDLGLRIVKNVVDDNFPRKNIQLHLLIAGGKQVETPSVAANTGGYILRTDGYSDSSPSTNCQRIARYVDDAGSIKSPGDFDGQAVLDEDIPVEETIKIESDHYLYLPKPPSCDEVYWNKPNQKQRIKIYKFQFVR